ncbi:MAG TPA: pseudouridine synthase, partial [Bacteroidia bacterium]|nr:pseudouridine synthase [Bacteroidia bacterium]
MPSPSRKPDYSGKKRSSERRGGDSQGKKGGYAGSEGKKPFRSEGEGKREGSADRPFKKPYFKKDGPGEGRPERKSYGDKEGGERKSFGDSTGRRSPDDRAKREPRGDKPAYKKPYFKKEGSGEGREERKSFGDKDGGARKTFGDSTGRRSADDRPKREPRGDKPYRKPYFKREEGVDGERKSAFGDSKERKPFNREERPARTERPARAERPNREERPRRDGDKPGFKKPYFKKEGREERKPFRSREEGKGGEERKPYEPKPFRAKKSFASPSPASADGLIRLNKYIANAGICSRREADKLIETGVISVNGKVVTELGYKIAPTDIINFGGQTLKQEKMVYLLLNKPKDYITTLEDPEGRKTVLELIRNAGRERVYPVGRLDRNTTGLLLLTNDGDLTKKLTHPRYGVRKIYHVTLDKGLTKGDMQKIADGVELEDGIIKADDISYVGDG